MLITILTMGSRGDVQPYLALGLALQKTGVQVRVATLEMFADFVRGLGLECYPIPGDLASVMNSAVADNARQADNPLKFARSFNELKRLGMALQKHFFAACQEADLVVYHPGMTIGYFAAQERGIPSVLAAPFPMAATRAYPSLIFSTGPRLGKTYNLLTHQVFQQIFWMVSRGGVADFWKREFGRLPANFGSPFPRQTRATHPTVVSCSPHIFPQTADFPPHVHQTGFWFLDDEPNWQPPTALTDFLERGPAPVYIGFGSIGDPKQATQTTQLILEALARSGERGVLATGWSGTPEGISLPESIYLLESAPHAWLFPRMAVVVHHGGAGTTAAGLRAGVPSIVIPHGNDQFAWAQRVYELGVAARPISRKKLTAENLAEAIRFVLKSEVREAAKVLGAKIREENGAETAAKIILAAVADQPAR
ncbi:MAG: glycosyltransferase [Chloroflexi bacterium]|nr:glycosyltransferase [Chloroflexota bacterium]